MSTKSEELLRLEHFVTGVLKQSLTGDLFRALRHAGVRDIFDFVILTNDDMRRLKVPGPNAGDPDEPELPMWNRDPIKRESNNCYNYATNVMDNSFAQPGAATMGPIAANEITCKGFLDPYASPIVIRALADGLKILHYADY